MRTALRWLLADACRFRLALSDPQEHVPAFAIGTHSQGEQSMIPSRDMTHIAKTLQWRLID
jgi:hypothetical protein